MQNLVFRLGRRALPAALIVSAALAAPAGAVPVSVKLRVEGRTATTFEAPVTTDGHDVTTQSGGTHKCDGTNGGVHPTPGPTATAALDDASKLGGFTWDGTWNDDFDDYFVTRVGPDSQTQSQFWGVFVNGVLSQVGGCQQRVRQGNEVVWAFDAFNKIHALRLTGPGAATTGSQVPLTVTDSRNGAPIAGARVAGTLTGADGMARPRFPERGIYRLKAERADSVRSNVLVLCVDPPNAAPCTSTDRVAPTLLLAGTRGSLFERSTSRTFYVAWQAQDRNGSGVANYDVGVRELGGAANSAQTPWKSLARRIRQPRVRFRGGSGRGYEFRISATDRAGNRSRYVTTSVLVPIDDRDRKLVRLSRGWRRLARKDAWGKHLVRTRRRGATMRVRFRGRRALLIGRRLRKGGRVRISVGGKSKVVRLRGRYGRSQVLTRTRGLRPGNHVLRVRSLRRRPVVIDAIGVEP